MMTRYSSLLKLAVTAATIFSLTATPFSQSQFAVKKDYAETARWKTLILQSPNEIKVAAPPGKEETQKELAEIKAKMATVDAKTLQQIQYWDAGAPAYRWNEIAYKQLSFEDISRYLRFPTSWVNMAIYDATLTAWKSKYDYNRKRPFHTDGSINPLVAPPATPSYPCEHTVTAAAAATVLAYFYPEKADSILKLAKEAAQSRVLAGIQYPSDIAEGWKLGEKVAARIIEQAKKDGADVKYNGTLSKDPKLWYGPYPVGINVRNYKPIFLKSADQFRPPAPPDFAKEMKEMKEFKQNFRSMNLAFYWASLSGFDFWTEMANKKIFEERLDRNTPVCARIYALLNVAMYDASIAIMDAKYAYRGTRPDLYDSTFRPLIGFTPPFPGYPSGHATASSAAATVLSYFFPADKAIFKQAAQECADSRFYAGIHFQTDNNVGLDLGEKLATYIIDSWTKKEASGMK
ncbi:MAG TPA: phosphatase PAP2 family protein [Chitinophagaceae bacterium]|nr:phosphatase PAP2 family protein [Chitinophagaceae bacterium]